MALTNHYRVWKACETVVEVCKARRKASVGCCGDVLSKLRVWHQEGLIFWTQSHLIAAVQVFETTECTE